MSSIKYCIVTGATSGIGLSLCSAFSSAGFRVTALGRNAQKLRELSESIPHKITTRIVDLEKDTSTDQFLDCYGKQNSSLDVLIHCAGLHHLDIIPQISKDQLRSMFQVNVIAPLSLSQGLMPLLKKASGTIVFLNSSIVAGSRKSAAGYSATRQAMKSIAETLRLEVNPDGIRVLSVYPGRTATAATSKLFKGENKSYDPEKMLQPEDIAHMILESVSLPKTAELTDLYIRSAIKSY